MKFIAIKKWGKSGGVVGDDAMGQWYDVLSRKPVSGEPETERHSDVKTHIANYDIGNVGNENTGVASVYGGTEQKYSDYRRPVKIKSVEGNYLKVLCLLLACLIMGVGGGTASYYIISQATASGADENTAQEIQAVSTPVESVSEIETDVLTAQEIYYLGSQQTVGVSTEIAGINVFGQETDTTSSGTGIIFSDDGYILTNYHVVEMAVSEGYKINVVLNDGSTYEAQFIGKENDMNDVAILKIAAEGLNAATIGDSDSLEVGESIYTVGNPLDELANTMTSGIVSALNRDISFSNDTGTADKIKMFQIDAAVNSGNSGGPVYNAEGEVIGIVTAKYSSSNFDGLGFAIPINDVMTIVEDLINYGYVSGKASLGVDARTINSTVAIYYDMREGAFIVSIFEGSCAERAGLLMGDIIVKVGDYDIFDTNDLSYALKNYAANDTVTVTVYRGDNYVDVQVTFDEDNGAPDTSIYVSNESSIF